MPGLTTVWKLFMPYRGISRGLTLIEGKMHAKLTNGNGVVMYLAGETEGLASSIGVQAFEVILTD